MANTTSAEKRNRQNSVRRERNRSRRAAVKTQVRKFLDAVHEKDAAKAAKEFQATAKILDKTAAKGTLHKKTASRKKSRMARRLNALAKSTK